jgi:hypothetical protein
VLAGALAGDVSKVGRANWSDVEKLADEHLVSPALWVALSRQGSAEQLPVPVADRLRTAYLQNVGRNLALRLQAREVIGALNRSGVEPILLKGALYLLDGTLSDVGERVMADLDLVVPHGDFATSAEALEDIGYRPEPGKPYLHPHELPMVRPDRAGSVELHRDVGSPPLPSVLPTTEVWESSAPLAVDGLRARALSPTHRVLHNVLHAQVQDLNFFSGGLPLRQLLTLVLLDQTLGPKIDWSGVREPMRRHGLGSAFHSYVFLAHRLFRMPLPAGEAVTTGGVTHYLRCLAFLELGWPADLIRNVSFALGADYLDHLYGHKGRPAHLAFARARHLGRVCREQGRASLSEAFAKRR